MASSRIGWELFVDNVKQALGLRKKKETVRIVHAVISSIEKTLMDNMDTNRFSIKLGKFGKFMVRHSPVSLRRIPLTGENQAHERQAQDKVRGPRGAAQGGKDAGSKAGQRPAGGS